MGDGYQQRIEVDGGRAKAPPPGHNSRQSAFKPVRNFTDAGAFKRIQAQQTPLPDSTTTGHQLHNFRPLSINPGTLKAISYSSNAPPGHHPKFSAFKHLCTLTHKTSKSHLPPRRPSAAECRRPHNCQHKYVIPVSVAAISFLNKTCSIRRKYHKHASGLLSILRSFKRQYKRRVKSVKTAGISETTTSKAQRVVGSSTSKAQAAVSSSTSNA